MSARSAVSSPPTRLFRRLWGAQAAAVGLAAASIWLPGCAATGESKSPAKAEGEAAVGNNPTLPGGSGEPTPGDSGEAATAAAGEPRPEAGPGDERAAAGGAEAGGRPLEVDRSRLGMFAPLPDVMEDPTPPQEGSVAKQAQEADILATRIDLGRMLYFDPRLSKNQDISCNTCHDLAHHHGAEPRPVSLGHKAQAGRRNSPSVYNAAGHVAQFWDGRSPHVEHQATQPLVNPKEMATTPQRVVAVVGSLPAYVRLFKKAFPTERSPISIINIGRAIGAFERRLTTPGRWDRFLKGDDDALTQSQLRGLNTFQAVGCAACHNGAYMGGQMYQRVGIAQPWPNQADQGRFEVTHQAADKMVFKVPSLRNVADTAPYFHDGSVADLSAAVRRMATMQLGLTLTDPQVDDIVIFLSALTGKIPADFIVAPNLPPTNSKTPRPDPT